MAEDIFYVVELALPREHLPDFVTWYAGVHAPHLFQGGFTTCTSYLAVSGGLSVVDIYQAKDWSLFHSAPFARYRALASADPYRPAILAEVTNPRTVYHHHAGSPLPSRDPAAPFHADWVLMWRFPGDASLEKRVAAWLDDEGDAALRRLGAQGVRLLHRGKDTPTGTSFRPALAVVTEWDRRPAEAAANAALPDWIRAAIGDEEGFAGLRLYPWPDVPASRAEMLKLTAGARS
ncbi:hypothetical protein [Falsiroseomonas sp. HW251]|uniref:hypothetical protein n=1 Tax=Falsiroseomonas sp. HW251 TaxID=3390998 RepID=UPI003D30EFDA